MALSVEVVAAARAGDEAAFNQIVGEHRRELRAHCYRLSGSLHDADDLLQESLLRAWRGLGGFLGQSSLRSWLYRVTTNTCLDALDARRARTLPEWMAPPVTDASAPMAPRPDLPWIEPCPDEVADATPASPEARLDSRQSVALAFLVALQHLPPRQRAVLLLRDVVGLQASECAEVLEMTLAAVTSALQRARETLDQLQRGADRQAGMAVTVPIADSLSHALARYMRAWEEADVTGLVSLLRDDARLAMPPFEAWFEGAAAIGHSLRVMVLPPEAAGRFKLIPMQANGLPACASYARDDRGVFRPSAIHVLTMEVTIDGPAQIGRIDAFLDVTLFEKFGLPPTLPNPAQR